MQNIPVHYKGKIYQCVRYGLDDEPAILDVFFFWKTSVLLAEQTKSKKPQLPETFSERFCCLTCDLVHQLGTGLDAFRIDANNHVLSSIEIKATITESGFTDLKRDLAFDELFWLSFSGYASLSYSIYRIMKQDIEAYVEKSKTQRDRATVKLKNIVAEKRIKPLVLGRIGIIQDPLVSKKQSTTSLTNQVARLPDLEQS